MSDPIAVLAGVLLGRGVPPAEVAELTRQLGRIQSTGIAPTIELPQYRLQLNLAPRGGARHLSRPATVVMR